MGEAGGAYNVRARPTTAEVTSPALVLGNANPGNPKPGYPGYPLFCQTRNPGLRKPGFTQTRLNPGLLETKPGFLKTFSTTISVVNLI